MSCHWYCATHLCAMWPELLTILGGIQKKAHCHHHSFQGKNSITAKWDHGVFDTLHGGMESFHGGNRTFHGRNYRKRKVTTVVKINMSMDNNRPTMVLSKVSMEAVQVSIHRVHSSMRNDGITIKSRSLFYATLVFVRLPCHSMLQEITKIEWYINLNL